jgi:hypothetical protein
MDYAKKVLLGGRLLIEIHGKVFTNRAIKKWACPRIGESPFGVGLYARSPVPTLPDMCYAFGYT